VAEPDIVADTGDCLPIAAFCRGFSAIPILMWIYLQFCLLLTNACAYYHAVVMV
jgi:hypothetical protein